MKLRSKAVIFTLISLVLLSIVIVPSMMAKERLILATTTSTANSGLLDYILPDFEAKYGYKVDVVAVGTGQAIALGERGDADVLLVHARSLEDKFVADGYGVNRRDVMYNDFVVLGPESDPAKISSAKDATEAFTKIAQAKQTFISRGDQSGTNVKELAIWDKAGIKPSGSWYRAVGQGMGACLTMASESLGYVLTDRGTWLAMKDKLDLKVLFEGDPVLFNPYGIIAVNPKVYDHVNYDGAMALIAWFTSPATQEKILSFTVGGDPLFMIYE